MRKIMNAKILWSIAALVFVSTPTAHKSDDKQQALQAPVALDPTSQYLTAYATHTGLRCFHVNAKGLTMAQTYPTGASVISHHAEIVRAIDAGWFNGGCRNTSAAKLG
jgi:hypothetical protein